MKSLFLLKSIFLSVVFVSILCTSCSESPDRDQGFTLTRRDEGKKRIEEPPSATREGKITSDELTPELFVEITIRHQKETKRWLETSRDFPAEEQEAYLERMNREFFEKLGMTEEEYVEYSESHIEELNAYIEAHPELMAQLMDQ
jgi:hypothetical protein